VRAGRCHPSPCRGAAEAVFRCFNHHLLPLPAVSAFPVAIYRAGVSGSRLAGETPLPLARFHGRCRCHCPVPLPVPFRFRGEAGRLPGKATVANCRCHCRCRVSGAGWR